MSIQRHPMGRNRSQDHIMGTMHSTTITSSNSRLHSGLNNILRTSLTTSVSNSNSHSHTPVSQLGASKHISVIVTSSNLTGATQHSNNNTPIDPIDNNRTVVQPSNKHTGIINTNNMDTRMTRARDKHIATAHTISKATSAPRTRMPTTIHPPSIHHPCRTHRSSKATGAIQTSKAMTAPPHRTHRSSSNMTIQRKIRARRVGGSVSVLRLAGFRPKETDLVSLVCLIRRAEVGAFRMDLRALESGYVVMIFLKPCFSFLIPLPFSLLFLFFLYCTLRFSSFSFLWGRVMTDAILI
jgi:hypothetical protein